MIDIEFRQVRTASKPSDVGWVPAGPAGSALCRLSPFAPASVLQERGAACCPGALDLPLIEGAVGDRDHACPDRADDTRRRVQLDLVRLEQPGFDLSRHDECNGIDVPEDPPSLVNDAPGAGLAVSLQSAANLDRTGAAQIPAEASAARDESGDRMRLVTEPTVRRRRGWRQATLLLLGRPRWYR